MIQNPPIPVVITGSQRTFHDKDSDAKNNFLDALTVAARWRLPGFYIVFKERIIQGEYASKASTTSLDAFRSVNHQDAGYINQHKQYIHYTNIKRTTNPNTKFVLQTKIDNAVKVEHLVPGYELNGLTILLKTRTFMGS